MPLEYQRSVSLTGDGLNTAIYDENYDSTIRIDSTKAL